MPKDNNIKFAEKTIELLNEKQTKYEFLLPSDIEAKTGEICSFTDKLPIGIKKKDLEDVIPVVLVPKEKTPEETCNKIIENLDDIVKKINSYSISKETVDDFVENICTSEYLKENVIPTLYEDNLSDGFIEDKISIPFFDMRILFKIQLLTDIDEENTSVMEVFLTKHLLNIIHDKEGVELSVDEVFEYAKNNVIKKQHLELQNLDDYMMKKFVEIHDILGDKFLDMIVDDLSDMKNETITKENFLDFMEDLVKGRIPSANYFIMSNSEDIDCTGLIFNRDILKMFRNNFGEDFGIAFIDEKRLVVSPESELKHISLNSLKELRDNGNSKMLSNKIILYSSEEDNFSEYIGNIEGIKV
jgi:hypothetical protein